MASWFLFALAAAMLWALDNILDKRLLTGGRLSAYSYDILTNLNDILPALLIPLFLSIRYDPVFSWVAFLFGALIVFSLLYYNKAMMREEASRIASFEWTSPIFVVILSYIIFGEVLSFWAYIGILLIVSGAFIISHKKRGKIIVSPVLRTIIVFSFLFAVGDIVSDFSLNYIDFWSFFFWASAGSVAGSLSMLGFPKIRRGFLADIQNLKINIFLMVLAVSVIYYVAEVFFYAALSLGPVSLVVAVVAVQPMFTFVYALLLSFYKPEFLKEQTDEFNIVTKLLGILTIMCGAGLIAVF